MAPAWPAAANAMGTLGAICWSVQLLPQIYQNRRRRHTHGLQPTMMLLWASAGIPLGVYNIIRAFPVALQIQPQILTLLSLITWAQTRYYPPGRGRDGKVKSALWCAGVLGVICVVAGAVEVGLVYAIRAGIEAKGGGNLGEHEVEYYWPVVLMGVLSAVLLAAGVGRHYFDIWKERTVRGISFVFVAIDALGDLTSLMSVVFWWKAGRRLDILGLVVYGSELVLWIGVMACGLWYNFRPWAMAKLNGTSVMPTEHPETRIPPLGHEQDEHADETRSTLSVASQSSSTGSAFRTASGRLNTELQSRHGSVGHDVLRMRNIVQV